MRKVPTLQPKEQIAEMRQWLIQEDDPEIRSRIEELIAGLEVVQQNMHLTAGTSRKKGTSKRKTATVKRAGSPRRK